MSFPIRCCILLCLLLGLAGPACASVEVAWSGQRPKLISEVYNRDGVAYLAIDDVLSALHMKGRWDPVEHRFRFHTPMGRASFFPGGTYLRVGEQFIPLEHPPRFIDGRLRVAEDFVLVQLPALSGNSIYYRNLNPGDALQPDGEEGALDQLFAFLLRKKTHGHDARLRGVAIDVGHGGTDPGVIGPGGVKEKELVLGFAVQLEKLIKMRLGIPVYLSRDGDYTLDTKARLKAVDQPEVDALLVLHAQGHFSPAVSGIEMYVRPETLHPEHPDQSMADDSTRLAIDTRQALLAEGFEVAEIRSAPLLPLGKGDLPTVLIELGYLTNADDLAMLRDEEARQLLAETIFRGLKTFDEETRSPQ